MITYFSLEWQDWSCHPGDALSSTLLIISGSKKKVTYGELDGRGNILFQQDGPLQASDGGTFFALAERIVEQWGDQTDFSVPVCDGSCWKIKVRYNRGKTLKYTGTVAYPPDGQALERALQALCDSAGIQPKHYFGCCDLADD